MGDLRNADVKFTGPSLSPGSSCQGSQCLNGQLSPFPNNEDSPSHNGLDSPPHNDQDSPFSCGQESPFSCGQESPSPTRQDSPKKAAKKQPVDILKEQITQNEKLQKEQIILVREMNAAKGKLKLLMNQYEHLKHCNNCLDEAHKDLLRSGDFSHDISIDRNNQQSFSSQACLDYESTKMVSPMINVENNGPPITVNDNQSHISLGSTDERQAVKASNKRTDCCNNKVPRETISEQQIIHHPDSQEKEIETITRFLTSSPRAELPMKRSYAREDVEEFCLEHTEHGHEPATGSVLRERNGQSSPRGNAFTEERRVSKQAIQLRANGICCKSRRIVRPEVCIRPNVEYKNNSCRDEATDESNLIKPVRNIEDELLTERFTALSVSHDENIRPANDVTDKAKDKETRTQSDNEETSEIKDKNEILTEAESVTKAEDRSHDDNLLEESMKNLHVSDTNITSDKTKDLSVADNEMQKAGWSKDRNMSFTENNIKTEKKKDHGVKSLLDKNNENLPVNNSLVAQQTRARSTKEDGLVTYYSPVQQTLQVFNDVKGGPPLKTNKKYNNLSGHIMSVFNKVWHKIYPGTKASGVIQNKIHETKIFSTSLKEDTKSVNSSDLYTETKPRDTANIVEK